MRVHPRARAPLSMKRCSDGDFKTLLNNSLQLHSSLDASKGKKPQPDSVEAHLRVYCNLAFLICQPLISAGFLLAGTLLL